MMMPQIEEDGTVGFGPQFLGWLDVLDILKGLLADLRLPAENAPVRLLELMNDLEQEGRNFASKSVVTVRDMEDRGLVFLADAGSTTVLDAIQKLFMQHTAKGVRNLHRLAIFDNSGEIVGIVSQMDVLRWLLSKEESFPQILDKTIDELGLLTGRRPVLTVNVHDITLMAFHKIVEAGVSGAPVLSDQGELVANLSVSDLRALTEEHFGMLALPLGEFLALEHHLAYVGYSSDKKNSCEQRWFYGARKGKSDEQDLKLHIAQPNSSLRSVLNTFLHNHVHRVYIINEKQNNSPVESVLTLTDILQFMAGIW